MAVRFPGHKTKIVCTVGPASRSERVLKAMIREGMSVARLNFAHGTIGSHREDIHRIRKVAGTLNRSCAIIVDLPGSKIRVGKLVTEPVLLREGDAVTLTTRRVAGTASLIPVDYRWLADDLSRGSLVYLNDGFIQLRVETVAAEKVVCRVLVGGNLLSQKGVSLPGAKIRLDPVTEKDLDLVGFGLEEGVDAFGLSFVGRADDVLKVKEFAAKKGGSAYVIAKIERAEALAHIDEILVAADAVMIARGDLGVEIPIEDVPMVQKKIIHKAAVLGRPVITATQMLLSMTEYVRPTRAEVSDVANAILDGTDAVMLSEETAIGRHPARAVEMMARIAVSVETGRRGEPTVLSKHYEQHLVEHEASIEDVISFSVVEAARFLPAECILAPTANGDGPRKISRFRPPCWIIALTGDEAVLRFMNLSYGVQPVFDNRTYLYDKIERLIRTTGFTQGALAIVSRDCSRDHSVEAGSLTIVRLRPHRRQRKKEGSSQGNPENR